MILTCYFTTTDEDLTIAGEMSGAPGLDEHSDTFYAMIQPYKGVVFHATPGAALEYGLQQNHEILCEARAEPAELLKGLNSALDDNVEDLNIMVKEVARLSAVV